MRYHFIPLALVVGLLAGCGDDPTSPTVKPLPLVNDGPTKAIPITDPSLCLKQQLGVRIDQGGFESLPPPVVCRKVR